MKKIFAAIALVFGTIVLTDAQTTVRNEKLSQDGTDVTVTLEVDTDGTNLPNLRKEVILPYIYNGKDTLFLDAVEESVFSPPKRIFRKS